MSTSYEPIRVASDEWTDIVAINGSLSGLSLTIQNIKSKDIRIVWGGATAPTTPSSGNVLKRGEGVNGSATNIWIKGYGGFAVTPLDNG